MRRWRISRMPGRRMLALALALLLPLAGQAAERIALLLDIDGPIGPATADYIARGIDAAEAQSATLVILRMDTPGGLDSAMRRIVKHIASASLPIVTYVAPTGARAASAGTYILYASHIAAMAPGTNLGAATPVELGGSKEPKPATRPEAGPDQKTVPDNADAKRRKVVNDAVAYLRGLAELRGRNADWAEQAVREGASLSAEQALKQKVIDIMATDLSDLLQQLQGRKIQVQGREVVLDTEGLVIRPRAPDWRNRLLSVITDPNIAYILMLIGIYGLILEFYNPGSIVPGTVGAISLLLALYAFQLLPINYAGMALILLGVGLMIGEALQPSFGMLGIGGVVAFIFGSIILMDTEAPGYGIDLSVILTFAALSVAMFVMMVGMALKARRRKVVTGMEQLIGSEARVLEDFEGNGRVRLHGEIWQAHCPVPVHKGQTVRVTDHKGLTLEVEPLDAATKEETA